MSPVLPALSSTVQAPMGTTLSTLGMPRSERFEALEVVERRERGVGAVDLAVDLERVLRAGGVHLQVARYAADDAAAERLVQGGEERAADDQERSSEREDGADEDVEEAGDQVRQGDADEDGEASHGRVISAL